LCLPWSRRAASVATRPSTASSASITCHCLCTLPAVGTNEPIENPFRLRDGLRLLSARGTRPRLVRRRERTHRRRVTHGSASLEGRQTKRIPAISAVVKGSRHCACQGIAVADVAVFSLRFRQRHTRIDILSPVRSDAGYQNCAVLPNLITSPGVAPGLPPVLPIGPFGTDEMLRGRVWLEAGLPPRSCFHRGLSRLPVVSAHRMGHCRCFAKRNPWSVWI
jgi:hypothetical protein